MEEIAKSVSSDVQSTSSDVQSTSSETPIKRRGRPKGSKNKARISNPVAVPIETTPAVEKPVAGVTPTVHRTRANKVPIDPNWIVTRTSFGTPIAIVGIIPCGHSHELMVIPRAEEGGTSKTTVNSKSVVRPTFANVEQEKEFDGVVFWTKPETDTLNTETEPVDEKTKNAVQT